MSAVLYTTSGSKVASAGNPDKDVVKILEEWLKVARDGELSGIHMVGVYQDGSNCIGSQGLLGGYRTIGAMECLKQRLVEQA